MAPFHLGRKFWEDRKKVRSRMSNKWTCFNVLSEQITNLTLFQGFIIQIWISLFKLTQACEFYVLNAKSGCLGTFW